MEWVKLVATPAYYLDAALLRAGEAAEVLFVRGLAHCGALETEGRIDKASLPMIVTTRAAARAAALVREGLWLDRGDHYLVRSWETWQEEHDAAAERKRRDRERKRRARQAAKEASAERPRTVRGPSSPCPALEGDRDRDRESVLPLDTEVDVDVPRVSGRAADRDVHSSTSLRLLPPDPDDPHAISDFLAAAGWEQ